MFLLFGQCKDVPDEHDWAFRRQEMKKINPRVFLTVTPKASCCPKSNEQKNTAVAEDAVVRTEKGSHFRF